MPPLPLPPSAPTAILRPRQVALRSPHEAILLTAHGPVYCMASLRLCSFFGNRPSWGHPSFSCARRAAWSPPFPVTLQSVVWIACSRGNGPRPSSFRMLSTSARTSHSGGADGAGFYERLANTPPRWVAGVCPLEEFLVFKHSCEDLRAVIRRGDHHGAVRRVVVLLRAEEEDQLGLRQRAVEPPVRERRHGLAQLER